MKFYFTEVLASKVKWSVFAFNYVALERSCTPFSVTALCFQMVMCIIRSGEQGFKLVREVKCQPVTSHFLPCAVQSNPSYLILQWQWCGCLVFRWDCLTSPFHWSCPCMILVSPFCSCEVNTFSSRLRATPSGRKKNNYTSMALPSGAPVPAAELVGCLLMRARAAGKLSAFFWH